MLTGILLGPPLYWSNKLGYLYAIAHVLGIAASAFMIYVCVYGEMRGFIWMFAASIIVLAVLGAYGERLCNREDAVSEYRAKKVAVFSLWLSFIFFGYACYLITRDLNYIAYSLDMYREIYNVVRVSVTGGFVVLLISNLSIIPSIHRRNRSAEVRTGDFKKDLNRLLSEMEDFEREYQADSSKWAR